MATVFILYEEKSSHSSQSTEEPEIMTAFRRKPPNQKTPLVQLQSDSTVTSTTGNLLFSSSTKDQLPRTGTKSWYRQEHPELGHGTLSTSTERMFQRSYKKALGQQGTSAGSLNPFSSGGKPVLY